MIHCKFNSPEIIQYPYSSETRFKHLIKSSLFLSVFLMFSCNTEAGIDDLSERQSKIIDHTCTNLLLVPETEILKARQNLVIAYGHTSHGSQIVTGISELDNFMMKKEFTQGTFACNSTGNNGALKLYDTPFSEADDLGSPNRTAWAEATRNYIPKHPEVNVVMWSWCGQVSSASKTEIDSYLQLMSQLETDYPSVVFVYMTGHLDGGGADGNLNLRNEQIRKYCNDNQKVLFDFADIESYDPDGIVNYMLLNCNDNCDYDSDGNGSLDKNWALNWQNTHIQNVDWYSCSAAHSQALNGNRKAFAFWWLMARIAGWNGITTQKNVELNERPITLCYYNSSNKSFQFSNPVKIKNISLVTLDGQLIYSFTNNEPNRMVVDMETGSSGIRSISGNAILFYRILTSKQVFTGKVYIE